MVELVNKYTWTWTKVNGIAGYNVEGPNGNSIFLPAAGQMRNQTISFKGSYSLYMMSTFYEKDCRMGNAFMGASEMYLCSHDNRCYGFSVRPVQK